MGTSLFLARVLGPYCMIAALGVLVNQKRYFQMMDDYFQNAALIYVGGIIALLFGLIVVQVHNFWAAHWAVIITVFGWLAIVKGIALIVFPQSIAKLGESYKKNTTLLRINLIIVFLLGAYMTYCGYFV